MASADHQEQHGHVEERDHEPKPEAPVLQPPRRDHGQDGRAQVPQGVRHGAGPRGISAQVAEQERAHHGQRCDADPHECQRAKLALALFQQDIEQDLPQTLALA